MHILVVDDDQSLCSLLSRFLEKNGQRVHSASDALQALDILEREPIQFVITDIRMPHMDGVRFTEAIKGDERFRNLPVVLMTGAPADELSDQGMRKGAAMILPKPVDFNRLLNLVRFAE